MRFVYFSLPASGHIHPSLGIIRSLTAMGHAVRYYSLDDFRKRIEETGAEYREYGPLPYDARRPDRDVIRISLALLQVAGHLIPRLEEELRVENADVILYDAYAPWGRFIAERKKIRSIAFIPTFAFHKKLIAHFSSPLRLVSQGIRSMNAIFLHLIESFLFRIKFKVRATGLLDLTATAAPLNLVFTSREFQPVEKVFDDRYRFVGPILDGRKDPESFPLEALEGKRVVFVSLGTLYNDRMDFFRACLASLENFDGVVILATGNLIEESAFEELKQKASKVFRVVRRLPQLEILKRADLFLSHGGMNSASESLYFGVPLLLFPQIDEQRMVAERVATLGAGLILKENELRKPAFREKVETILGNPSFGMAAEKIGATLRSSGGAPRGVKEILDFCRQEL